MTERKQLSHAYIVCSPSQEEALARAERIAAAAVCSEGGSEPCGVCRNCRKALRGIHPDIIRITPDKDESGKLKKNILVDRVRALIRDAYVLPNEAEGKAYIVSPAQTMNTEAQNAALKLLEEPPRGVVIILCSDSAEKFLPTVRSRCIEENCAVGKKAEKTEFTAMADEFLAEAVSGSRTRVFSWCVRNEEMDRASGMQFFSALEERIADALSGRAPIYGADEHELFALAELAEKCFAYLDANVGSKHVFGLLAVDFKADGENRG